MIKIGEDGRVWWLCDDQDLDDVFSSIVGVAIPAVPHRSTHAATESASYLVPMTGDPIFPGIMVLIFSVVPTA